MDDQLDKLSNLIMHLDSYTKGIQYTNESKVDKVYETFSHLKNKLPNLVENFKKIYLEMGGENYWK